eukprot:g5374.t1
MKARLATLLSWLVVLLSFASGGGEEILDSDCQLLGYGEALRCTSCKHFEDIIADTGLTAECLKCCKEVKDPVKKYASATLVYDPRLLSADPELRGFVTDRAADHPALKLQPTLSGKAVLLMSEEGPDNGNVETVSIRRWKLDSIADYLHEHL